VRSKCETQDGLTLKYRVLQARFAESYNCADDNSTIRPV